MIFRKGPLGIITLILVLSFSLTGSCAGKVIASSSYQNPIAFSNNNIYQTHPLFLGPVRPFVFRTDFLPQSAIKILKDNAGRAKMTPGGLVKFSKSGFPQFESLFTARLPGNMISDSSITKTGLYKRQFKEANRQLYKAILKDPELAKKFTQEQIESISQGITPEGYVWHHGKVTGQMKLVTQNQHGTKHVGGGALWVDFSAKDVLFKTMALWSKIALADWVISVGYSIVKNTLDVNELKKTTTGVVGAWMSASFVETAMNIIPRLLPFKWLPPLMTFHPAALTAGATYFITRFAISKLWNQIEIEQARRVENACLAAESQARWAKSHREVLRNNNTLNEISSEILEW